MQLPASNASVPARTLDLLAPDPDELRGATAREAIMVRWVVHVALNEEVAALRAGEVHVGFPWPSHAVESTDSTLRARPEVRESVARA
jgi:hypothetical protein